MQFTRLTKENIDCVKDYFAKSIMSFCDISLGEKYMWRDEYVIDFAIFEHTLIMKESCSEYQNVFYYPMGNNVEGALAEIEKYCMEQAIPLEFCCIDDKGVKLLAERYYSTESHFERDWNDYIYTAEQFKTYAGKKLSGQRNHVNKFKKLYPDYKFKTIEQEDLVKVHEFLEEYKTSPHLSKGAREEVALAHDYVDNVFRLDQRAGVIIVDGKIVALSIGEVVGDTLIVHVEKGLTDYQGVYPTMAQEFAKAFAVEGVALINREEDCGEEGLRISKTQYRPIEIKNKNAVMVKTLFGNIKDGIELKTDRLTLSEIKESEKDIYAKLYLDNELNKLWGYDYREDLGDNSPTPEYFYSFMQGLKDNKEEFSFAVRLNGQMIGEVVLHNFGFYGDVEMGFRFFTEFQNKGYALESATAVKEFVFNTLKAKTLKCKCYKQNLSSIRLIKKLGLIKSGEDDKYFYFELKRI